MSQVLFFLAAIGAITGAIGVVTLRNPFYSVLALVCHLIALAALFLLLRAEFVAAAQVVVYAGAVMVLYVFVVAYVGGSEDLLAGGSALRILGPLFAFALAVELCLAMLGSALKGINSEGAPFIPGFGSPRHIGQLFLTTYLFPFELASLLLLVAAIGAVVLARRRRGLEHDAELDRRLLVRRPANTGTMAEAAGIPQALLEVQETVIEIPETSARPGVGHPAEKPVGARGGPEGGDA
jgi:NADH:ubiquinone oxidoreductase subunit 6 (subunit J)